MYRDAKLGTRRNPRTHRCLCATVREPRRPTISYDRYRYANLPRIIYLNACAPVCEPCQSVFSMFLPVCRNRGHPTSSRCRRRRGYSRGHAPDELSPRRSPSLLLLLASIAHVHAHRRRRRRHPRCRPRRKCDRTRRRSEGGAPDSCSTHHATCNMPTGRGLIAPPRDESIEQLNRSTQLDVVRETEAEAEAEIHYAVE